MQSFSKSFASLSSVFVCPELTYSTPGSSFISLLRKIPSSTYRQLFYQESAKNDETDNVFNENKNKTKSASS